MRLTLPGAPRGTAVRPVVVGPHRPRKIGIIGSAAASLRCAPWQDPAWEFWAHASVVQTIPYGRADRLFDLHPKNCFTEERKNGFKNYYAWLQRCATPIYMQRVYEEIPASMLYPLEQIKQQWPDTPFGSQTAYMVALALFEGVTHLGFWGVDYSHKSEYEEQRANAEHWIGIAKGSGVHIVIPRISPLCHQPTLLYGYESHTPELYAARNARIAEYKKSDGPKGGPFTPARLTRVVGQQGLDIAAELRRLRDPDWCREAARLVEPDPEWLPKLGMPVNE